MSVKSRTPKEIKESLENVEQVIASFRLEGMEPPPRVREFLEMQARGEITADEGVEIAKKICMDEITADEGISIARKMAVTENV